METNGKAIEENIVVAGNARFTILTDRLIRMEYSPNGEFTDKASQFAFNRNFSKTEFSKTEFNVVENEYLTIETDTDGLCY